MKTFTRNYSLPEIQQEAKSGNGLLSAILWGDGNTLNIMLGRANLWDHRDTGCSRS